MEDTYVIVDEAGNVVSDFDTYEHAYEYMIDNLADFVEPVVMTQEEYSCIDT